MSMRKFLSLVRWFHFGRDIGYLPGTVEEKLHSWMLPIYDNMEFIMHSSQVGQHFEELDGDRYERRKREKGRAIGVIRQHQA